MALFYAQAPAAATEQAPPGNTDSPTVPSTPTEPVQEVVVGGERDSAEQTGVAKGTRDVVSHDELARYGDNSLTDALQRIPSITVDGVPGRGGEIKLRGLGNGYTQLLLNGEPVPANFSLDSLPPEIVERVEIIRAPSVDMSNQSIAGTINIILRKDVRRTRRDLKLGIGSMGGRSSLYLDSDLSDKKKSFSYSIATSASRESHPVPDQIYSSAVSQLPDSSYTWFTRELGRDLANTISLTPRLNWTLANKDTLTWESLVRYRRAMGTTWDAIEDLSGVPPVFANDVLQFSSRTSAARSELAWTHQLAHGSLDVKVSASLTDRNAFTTFDGYDDQQELALLRTVLGHTRDSTVALKGKLTVEVSDTNSLAYGWDGDYTHRQEDRLQNDITPTGLAPDNLDDAYLATVARFAMFAQDEMQVLPRLTAYYGIRWEGLDTRTTGNTIDAVHNRSGVWSPVLQLAWKPWESGKTEIDAALSRTYKAPTTAELVPRRFFSDINTQVTPDTQGNPNLRPELAWGLDLSASRPIEDDGTIAVRAFLRKIDNVILENIVLNNEDGRWVSFPVNNESARVTGVSLESKVNFHSLYSHAPPISVSTSVERTWSEVDALPGPNNLLAREIPFSATLGIDYAASKTVAFGTNLAYQGASLTQLSDTQGAYSGVVRNVDFYGTWKFTAQGQLRLSLKNVLHQDRIKYSSFIDATDTIYGYYATPSYTIGRLTLELAF